jgi:hypothetical protein
MRSPWNMLDRLVDVVPLVSWRAASLACDKAALPDFSCIGVVKLRSRVSTSWQ